MNSTIMRRYFPVIYLGCVQFLVFIFYFKLRSFDLDGDGFRSLILASKWHQEINLTNSWYHYRYWTSEFFLDVLALAIRSMHQSLDFFRSSVLVIAHIVVYACSLLIARKTRWQVGLAFLMAMAAAPVTWALASYTMGITTANFWLSAIASSLFLLFNVSLNPRYLYALAFVSALDLLHIYPSPFALYAGFGIGSLIILSMSQKPSEALRIALAAAGFFTGTFLLMGVIAGFLIAADPFAYFKLLPYTLNFYFETRVTETARLQAGSTLEELRWLFFGGEHTLPPNGECEIPMFVPGLWMIPGVSFLYAVILNIFLFRRSKVARRTFLMLAPLVFTLIAVRNAYTAQRHYMLVVVPSCLYVAQVLWCFIEISPKGRWSKYGGRLLWLSLVSSLCQAIWTSYPLMAKGFGKIPLTETYGRQSGNAQLLSMTAEHMLASPQTGYAIVLFSTYQVNIQLLMTEFVYNALPHRQIEQFFLTRPQDWSPSELGSKLVNHPPIVVLIDEAEAPKLIDSMTATGYKLTQRFLSINKASLFFD